MTRIAPLLCAFVVGTTTAYGASPPAKAAPAATARTAPTAVTPASPATPATPPATPEATPTTPAAPSATADAGEKKKVRRIAVYKLDAAGIDDRINRVITDSIVAELRKLEKTTVVGMDEIKAMLDIEAQKQLVGCSDASCVAEIAEALGVDGVVIGNVALVGDTISFGLKHIDQHTATTLGQAQRRINSTDPADVLAAVGPVVQELFPDVPLRPGAKRGVPPEIAFRIHPPPLEPWVFWTLAGTTAVAVTTGAVFSTWNALASNAALEKARGSIKGDPVPGAVLNQDLDGVRGSFIGLAVAYSTATVVAASAGVTALFTDWEHVGAAGSE